MATDRISGLSIGAAIKAACTVTSTTALTLSGVQVVDGISVGNAGERVLERNATNTANNGIWTARSSSWIRAQDCDGSKDLIPGTLVYVDRGTAYARTFWVFNSSETSTAITVGTEALSLSPVSVALSGVSAWVQNNLFPVVSAASARSVLGVTASTDFGSTLENTFTAAQTFSTLATFQYDTLFVSTNVSSTASPLTQLYRNSTSPIAGDRLGQQSWLGNPSGAGSSQPLAALVAELTSTAALPSGRFAVEVASSSTAVSPALYIGEGVYTAGATDPGLGAFNSSRGSLYQGLEYQRGWTYSTNSTANSSVFVQLTTRISTDAKEVEIIFDGVTCSSNAMYVILASTVGNSTAYTDNSVNIVGGTPAQTTSNDLGFHFARAALGSSGFSGVMRLTRTQSTAFTWLMQVSGMMLTIYTVGTGTATLPNNLVLMSLSSSAGGSQFTAGMITARWR